MKKSELLLTKAWQIKLSNYEPVVHPINKLFKS